MYLEASLIRLYVEAIEKQSHPDHGVEQNNWQAGVAYSTQQILGFIETIEGGE